MKALKKFSKRLLKNERGQGMMEYLLLLVIVVGLILMFKDNIMETAKSKIDDLQSSIDRVK